MGRVLAGFIVCLVVWAPSAAWADHPAECNGGPFAVPGLQDPPDQIGEWGPVQLWAEQATHATLLHTGKVLWWRGVGLTGSPDPATTYVWEPSTGANTVFPNSATDLFCAGHATLADGRVIAVGGSAAHGPFVGLAETNLFDPETETWTRVADMHTPRWYPTATTLPDGRVLALAGLIDGNTGEKAWIPEVYDVATDTWTELLGVNRSLSTYSFDFVLPNGLVFIAGPSKNTRTLDVDAETLTVVAVSYASGATSGAAMYRPGEVLKTGGSELVNLSQHTAQVIDMTAPTPAWRDVGDLVWPRRRHNTVILPDGTALVIGGAILTNNDGECAVHSAELWDPATEVFTEMASMEIPRIYHSTALLLPDGRVLSAGGEWSGQGGAKSAEIYSPPYLSRGPRPVIGAAPGATYYGQSFRVETPDAASIASVAFVRPGSVTHNFDENQRYVPLAFTPGSTHLDVDAPETPNVAPPGYYMLFLVDQNGVPSVAEFVLLGASAGVPVPGLSSAGLVLAVILLIAVATWAGSRATSRSSRI